MIMIYKGDILRIFIPIFFGCFKERKVKNKKKKRIMKLTLRPSHLFFINYAHKIRSSSKEKEMLILYNS